MARIIAQRHGRSIFYANLLIAQYSAQSIELNLIKNLRWIVKSGSGNWKQLLIVIRIKAESKCMKFFKKTNCRNQVIFFKSLTRKHWNLFKGFSNKWCYFDTQRKMPLFKINYRIYISLWRAKWPPRLCKQVHILFMKYSITKSQGGCSMSSIALQVPSLRSWIDSRLLTMTWPERTKS